MENLDNTTHKVIITLGSTNDVEDVGVSITLDPVMQGDDYKTLGYQPASHKFLEVFILPLLESIYMQTNFPELFADEPDSNGEYNPTVQ